MGSTCKCIELFKKSSMHLQVDPIMFSLFGTPAKSDLYFHSKIRTSTQIASFTRVNVAAASITLEKQRDVVIWDLRSMKTPVKHLNQLSILKQTQHTRLRGTFLLMHRVTTKNGSCWKHFTLLSLNRALTTRSCQESSNFFQMD